MCDDRRARRAVARVREHQELHRDPHGRRREPAPRLLVLHRPHPRAARGDAGRAPEAVHGVRDPPHDDALGPHARRGAAGADRGRAWARCPAAAPRCSPTAVRKIIAPGKEPAETWLEAHRHGARLGLQTHCTMLYGHVETYEERVEHLLRAARPAGRDRRLPGLHPAAVPPGEHGLRAARLAAHDRHRRPEDDRRVAPDARQHRARQGVLDHDLDAARPGGAALRRERHPGHGGRGEDRPRRRRRDADGGEGRVAGAR